MKSRHIKNTYEKLEITPSPCQSTDESLIESLITIIEFWYQPTSTMTSSEKLCLQWNDFKQNISASLGDLRGDEDFTDVTLVCEDGQQVGAHKVILVASSPFFKELLRKNKHSHPLVYMRGLKGPDLVSIMDFLYFGETNIVQENLESFLELAEELKLKGLTKGNENMADEKFDNKTALPVEDAVHRSVSPPQNSTKRIKTLETVDNNAKQVAVTNENKIFADSSGLDEQIRSLITKIDISLGPGKGKLAKCNICGKEAPYMSLPRHVEANHLEGVSHSCNICGAISRSKNGLRRHQYGFHNIR